MQVFLPIYDRISIHIQHMSPSFSRTMDSEALQEVKNRFSSADVAIPSSSKLHTNMPPFEDNLDEEETRHFWPIIVVQIMQFKIYDYISGAFL